MCIVIDINTLASVFDKKSANHTEFKDVFEWIFNGKGKIVYGGTKYITELSRTKYLPLFTEYNRMNKAVLVKADIDAETVVVSKMIQHPDFDDQHLVALLRVSKCKLVCSLDARAYPFFRHNVFFSPANAKPKIYKSSKNKGLLTDKNIADICKPSKATRKNKEGFWEYQNS